MTLLCKSGTFTSITTTGSQAITGVGFKPKGLLIFASGGASEDSYNANARCVMGATDQTNVAMASCTMLNNSSAHTDRANSTILFDLTNGLGTAVVVACNITTLDNDGFTLNFSTNTSAREYHYMAFGGSDLTNANTGFQLGPAATGNKSFTGIGFKPDFLLLFGAGSGTTGIPIVAVFSVGFAASTTARATATVVSDTAATRRTWQYQRTNKCFAQNNNNAPLLEEADLVSFDSDGFTLNYTTQNGVAHYLGYLALKGGKYNVGSFNAITTTGNQSITGVGFAPVGLLLTSFDHVSATTVQTNNRLSIGGGDNLSGVTHQQTFGENDADNVASGNSSTLDSKTHVFEALTTTSNAAQTKEMEATVNSWDSDGFTLNWGTNTATLGAIEILYVVFGNNPFNKTVFVEWIEG